MSTAFGTKGPGGWMMTAANPFADALGYATDCWEKSLLFWDVMRRRGNAYHENAAKLAPHVLSFAPELVIDGRYKTIDLTRLGFARIRDNRPIFEKNVI